MNSRITPACAGRRNLKWQFVTWMKDHPRVRGEKCARIRSAPTSMGSPPRARGEVENALDRMWREGITPACAGRSVGRGPDRARRPDHPRVRGEKSGLRDIMERYTGSPPRARGEVSGIFASPL